MKATIRLVAIVVMAGWGCGDFNAAPTCGAAGQACCISRGCGDGLTCTPAGICASANVRGCGDGTCSGGKETCVTCPTDCGACSLADAGTPVDVFVPIDQGFVPDRGIPSACPSACLVEADCNSCRMPSDPASLRYCCMSGICTSISGTCSVAMDSGVSDTPAATDIPAATDSGTWGCGDFRCNLGETCGTCPHDCPCTCSLGEGVSCTPGAAAPNCCTGGRTCGFNGVSNACIVAEGAACTRDEACGSGIVCRGGRCVRVCASIRLAMPCSSDAECCPGVDAFERSTTCVYNPGEGPGATCSLVCRTNADCLSGCCSGVLSNGLRVCLHASLCAARAGCTVSLTSGDGACTSDSQCCRGADVSPQSGTYCDFATGVSHCARLCLRSSDCNSGCCQLDPGIDVWRCVPTGSPRCAPP